MGSHAGVVLDPYTGKAKPEPPPQIVSRNGVPFTMEDNYRRGWRGGLLSDTRPDTDQLPDHIQEMLAKSSGRVGPFAGMRPPTADRSMYEVLRYWITADTSITAAAETIMVPAFNFGNSELQVGSCIKYTLIGSQSFAVTTPGTAIMRMRWGGVAGALQATSATLAPTGTQITTTASFALEYWMTVRTVGTAGTLWCQGRWEVPGSLETTPGSTTIMVTYLKATQIPPTGAAIGAAIDFTAALGPTPTYQSSVTTANCTTHLAFLELQN